jgi:hypothetical protein
MNKIILHVGAPKTGTSFIQSSLEKSSSNLAKLGIHYPTGKSTLPTSDAKIRSGNTNRKNIFHLCEKFVNQVKAPQECLLLSHEMLFSMFANDEKYFRFFNNLDIQVIVVLMIRNPIELVASTYGQEVKRGGYAKDFEFYITQFRMFDELFQFFESAEKYGVSVNFTNYSNAKNSLLNAFSELIGVPKNTLITPDAEVINRSLSDAETYIQKKFNEKYGREAHKFISDPLCEKLIHIKSGKPRLSEKSFLSFKEKRTKKSQHLIQNMRYQTRKSLI